MKTIFRLLVILPIIRLVDAIRIGAGIMIIEIANLKKCICIRLSEQADSKDIIMKMKSITMIMDRLIVAIGIWEIIIHHYCSLRIWLLSVLF